MKQNFFEFNEFSDNLVKAWKYAKSYPYDCCCPGCMEKAIKSHLLQQHPILESICDEKNSLLQMVDNDIDPRSGNWSFYSKREVGITNALQYKLFCKKHDNSLFKGIEIQNSIPKTKHDCLLLVSVLHVLFGIKRNIVYEFMNMNTRPMDVKTYWKIIRVYS